VRISISKKIGFGFALQVLLVLAGGALNIYQFQRSEGLVRQANEIREPLVQSGLRLVAAVNASRAAAIGELLYGSDVQSLSEYRNERRKHLQDAREQCRTMEEIAAKLDDDTRAKVQSVAAQVERLGQLHEQAEKLLEGVNGGSGDAFDLEKSQSSVVAFQVAAEGDSLVRQQKKLMDDQEVLIASSLRTAEGCTLLTLIMAIGLGLLIGRSVGSRIADLLGQVVTRASAIADGDMTGEKLESVGDDEIADLTGAMNRMQGSLAQMIHSVMSSSDQVSSAAEELSANATESALAGEDQRRQTELVKGAMEEMGLAVNAVADISRQAAQQSEEAANRAKSGGKVVEQTVCTMEQIAKETERVAGQVDQLGKRSQEIGKIVGVIDEIADQTNLLALNAAIEAARAGEQGRGFAVVADEVRKLAERTATATKEITTMISNMQAETKKAVGAMKDGGARVNSGVATAVEAGKSLHEIIAAAERVGEMVKAITEASEMQSMTTQQVQENVSQINRLVLASTTGSQESANACEALSGLALELQRSTARFKLDNKSKQNYGLQPEYPEQEPEMFANFVS